MVRLRCQRVKPLSRRLPVARRAACLALFNLLAISASVGWLFILAAPLLIKQSALRTEVASAAMRRCFVNVPRARRVVNQPVICDWDTLSVGRLIRQISLTIDDFANST